jgi:hypothetical protein
MAQNALAGETAGTNPFTSLSQLSNVLTGIDSFLFKPGQNLEFEIHCRLVYMRNTLIVAYDLWQNDINRRVSRSLEKFFVFCMTEGERSAFERRLVPGLTFAAEELRSLNIAALNHLPSVIDHCAGEAGHYANNNKACVRAGVENAGEMKWRNYTPLHRPHDPAKVAKGS